MQEGPVVNLIWATPNAEEIIVQCARVSVPPGKESRPGTKLLRYLMKHKHWSPFEMASICVEIWTTRDISRQIIRHRSFHYQEFSQRYAAVTSIQTVAITRQARLQDTSNRQNSLETDNESIQQRWDALQKQVWDTCKSAYIEALDLHIAKEQARAVLPEGMTLSHLFMAGTIRDFIHYINVRTDETAQKEHRRVAELIKDILLDIVPSLREPVV